MRKTIIIMAMTATLASCQDKYPDLENGVYAEFVTNQGTFVAKLYHDQTPLTVANFVDLANGKNAMVDSAHQGKPYYNGLIFHRVIKDFMIQGGDPDGTGSGGPGYQFPDEIVDELKHDRKGMLSMANAGPGTNGSQFFVTLDPTPHLDGRHTVFGEVVKGMDVVEAIGSTTTGTADKPKNDIVMEEVNIIDKGDNKLDSFEKQMEEMEAERKEAEARLSGLNAETLEELKALEAEAEELDSGLKMLFTEKGDGNTPNEGDTVLVNYEGYLLADGSLFDSNLKEVAEKHEKYDAQRDTQGGYTPMPAPYSPDAQFIAGFREGLLSMNVGDKAVLFIPSHLGYGPQGAGELIPPNADLVFKLEIVGIAE